MKHTHRYLSASSTAGLFFFNSPQKTTHSFNVLPQYRVGLNQSALVLRGRNFTYSLINPSELHQMFRHHISCDEDLKSLTRVA